MHVDDTMMIGNEYLKVKTMRNFLAAVSQGFWQFNYFMEVRLLRQGK